MPARMAMIAMTTSSSIRVNPLREEKGAGSLPGKKFVVFIGVSEDFCNDGINAGAGRTPRKISHFTTERCNPAP